MKLLNRRSNRFPIAEETPEEKEVVPVKKTRKSHTENTLPPDEYKDEIPPVEVPIDDKGKLVVSVKRGGEMGLPKVDIRYFATTPEYTGFTKKGVNFDLDVLPYLKSVLCDVIIDCDEKGLFEEFDED